jgi:hypothetical protein
MPPSNGDLFNEVDFAPGNKFAAIGGQQLVLTAGAYRVAIQAPLDEPAEADLTVTRVD